MFTPPPHPPSPHLQHEAAPECGQPLVSAQKQELLPVRSVLMSSGGVDLVVGWLGVEVLPDGVVMYGRSHSYKHVPNSVSEWDNAVTFEEDYPQTVAGPADQQLTQPGLLRLRRGIKFIIFKLFNGSF